MQGSPAQQPDLAAGEPRATPWASVPRPISHKIFGITAILLALMASVSYTATISMNRVSEQLTLLADYYIPLDQIEGQVRTHNLQQILAFERVLLEPAGKPFDEVSKLVETKRPLLGDCGDDRLSEVSAELRKSLPDRGARRMASYELQRLCGDAKTRRASELVTRALALDFVAGDASLVQKLTRLQTELSHVPQTRDGLHRLARRYLMDPQRRAQEDVLQDQLEQQRRAFNRQARTISLLLNEDTRHAAETVRRLERRAFWFNWGITALAVALGIACALLLTRNLVRPVRQLVLGARDIEQGNLDVRLEVISADEIALLTRSFNHMAVGLKEKEAIKATFGKYVDPRIVNDLIGGANFALQPAKRPMTVLFSDIEGFTSLCEQLTPDRVVLLLNEYLSVMSNPIRDSHGIIDKYIGDAIMAFWGPPFVDAARHASLACVAALDQQALLEGFRRRIPDLVGLRRGLAFNVRIGISTGEVTVGTIGSESARSYTVIGDSANLASRLESANKYFGTRIIVSHETWLLAQGEVEVRELDAIQVAGRQETTRVYELLARKGQLDEATARLRDRFAEGLLAYRQQAWAEARAAFDDCLTIRPDDGPARTLLARVGKLEQVPPGPDWDGVWRMEGK